MDIIPQELAVEILSIFGVLGSAWIVSNILSSNERSLFDRIFKRYNKIDNIYQLLPILQKNSKRLFLFFSDLTTSLKSVLSANDAGITKEMVEGILSHEYYKNKIIEVQNEVFKEFNVDYKEVEEATKRFSQDDQVEFYVSGVMRMYESVLNCTYPQCPGVEPNRDITQAKYFEILEKVTITETKKWIQKQPGNIGNWGPVATEGTVDGGKTINRFTSDANTRLNTASSVADRSSTESASSNTKTDTISNSGKHSIASERSNTAYGMPRNTSRTSGRGRGNNRASLLRKERLGGRTGGVSGSANGNGVNVDDEMKNNKEFQNIIMKELSKYGYDNYLDALVALKTSENYFYYFPNFNASKLAITAKVKRVYSSNDVQKVSRHELELILETSEEDSLVAVLLFDDLIDETSFNKLVTVSTSERPIEELNRQFGLKYKTVPNGTGNGVGVSVADGKDEVDGDQEKDVTDDRGEEVVEGVEAVDGVEVVGGRGGQVNSEGNASDNGMIGDDEGGRNTNSKVLNSLMNAATSREGEVTNVNEGEVEVERNNKNKVVTVWLFKEEFITSMKMQTYPALVIFNSGSMEEIRSI
ncbi:hypothetical protein MACJ_000431 [Theileria orientalis]|uniref:Uncharacterized protein n=1 Tax=Theileria orientalis TaxID=68886 RepID=A0A976QRC6_THEOR|nr:hypothetical protein MACJ_000431 [Theileria orientalis]